MNRFSLYFAGIALAIALFGQLSAQAQIVVGDAGGGSGYVNEYSLTGQLQKNPLVHTGNDTQGVAVSGNTLFTAANYTGTIGEYNVSTGAVINSSYIAGSEGSYGIAVGNGYIYVSNYYGSVSAYTQTATPTLAWTASAGTNAGDVVVSGTNLFVVHEIGDTTTSEISEYNALTGAVENATLVTGLDDTFGLAISGNDLFVSSFDGGTVGEYSTSGVIEAPHLVQNECEVLG